jgi:hypothetical protein
MKRVVLWAYFRLYRHRLSNCGKEQVKASDCKGQRLFSNSFRGTTAEMSAENAEKRRLRAALEDTDFCL